MVMIIFLIVSLFLQGALGELMCEKLPIENCAFSISSSGKRCSLETDTTNNEFTNYQCKTSEVLVNYMLGWIESDNCIEACGVDRYSIGISSDSLMEPEFTAKLCTPLCYENCPSIVDLYFNLALGEGAFLPDLCEAQSNPHRMMSQILSSSAASGPAAYDNIAPASASANIFANSLDSFVLNNEKTQPIASAPAPM